MRLLKDIVIVVIASLLALLVIYPFLHESGHAVALLLLNKNIVKFSFFPLPYVVCAGDMSGLQTAFVAISGNALPIFLLLVPLPEKLFYKCISFITGVVSMVFCTVSVISTFLPVPYDDAALVEEGFLPLLAILNSAFVLLILLKIFKLKFFVFLNNYSS